MSSIDSILSKEGKDFVRNVAESVGYSQNKIADILFVCQNKLDSLPTSM